MRVQNVALLFVAAFAHSASGAVRREILNRHAPRYFPSSNATTTSSTATLSIATTSTEPVASILSSTSLSDGDTTSLQTTDDWSSRVSRSSLSTEDPDIDTSTTIVPNLDTETPISITTTTNSLSSTTPDPTSHSLTSSWTSESTSQEDIDGPRRKTSSPTAPSQSDIPPPSSKSASGCSDVPNASQCGTLPFTSSPRNQTGGFGPTNGTITVPATTSTPCITPNGDEPVTEYSIVYTATLTFWGNRSDYTPPYETIETPNYCFSITASATFPTVEPSVVESSRPWLSNSWTSGDWSFHPSSPGGDFTSSKATATPCTDSACAEPSVPSYGGPGPGPGPFASTSRLGKDESGWLSTRPSSTRVTVTFITTDKNPSVTYPSDPVPSFNNPGNGGGHISAVSHKSVEPDGHGKDPLSVNSEPQPTFVVTAKGEEVTINDSTFSNLKPSQTTTVTVGGGTFTIFPTAVEGEGATVEKPQPVGTAVSVVTPTSSDVGGLPVVVSGSEAVIDGTRFNIPPAGTTTKVRDESVSIGPGKITVDGETLTFQASGGAQTDVIVTGGEMVTAIGQSVYVFHHTTLTYGPGIPETTEVVDDDTITIGTSGVVVDGTTIGGISARSTDTSYEIVGGATITKLSPSYVIIDGTTFTVGPGAGTTTKEIGGETITIGPSGITISTDTMSYPFGPSTVKTIKPSATATESFPVQTDDPGDDELDDNAGALVRPNLVVGITGFCIAIGVFGWI